MEGWTLLYKFVPICHRNFEVHLRNLNMISTLIYLNNYHLPLLILIKANQTLACSFCSVLSIFQTNFEPVLSLTETNIVKIPQKYSQFFSWNLLQRNTPSWVLCSAWYQRNNHDNHRRLGHPKRPHRFTFHREYPLHHHIMVSHHLNFSGRVSGTKTIFMGNFS